MRYTYVSFLIFASLIIYITSASLCLYCIRTWGIESLLDCEKPRHIFIDVFFSSLRVKFATVGSGECLVPIRHNFTRYVSKYLLSLTRPNTFSLLRQHKSNDRRVLTGSRGNSRVMKSIFWLKNHWNSFHLVQSTVNHPPRLQAIIWPNDGLFHRRIYASLGLKSPMDHVCCSVGLRFLACQKIMSVYEALMQEKSQIPLLLQQHSIQTLQNGWAWDCYIVDMKDSVSEFLG